METSIKKFLRKMRRDIVRIVKWRSDQAATLVKSVLPQEIPKIVNGLWGRKQCYICGKTFHHFTKYGMGSRGRPEFRKRLDMVGSDIDNFGCMYCGAHDRERHLYMFFDKLQIWNKMTDARILHFAPEKHLQIKIQEQRPAEYIKADLSPRDRDVRKIDATSLPFENDKFDFIVANHILEHIPAYTKALSEFYRVLRPGGIAILQTPYSKLLKNNFEDENIGSDELRLYFHGQADHVRTFAEHGLLHDLEDAGFDLQIKRHRDFFDDRMALIHGVNKNEDLIQVMKAMRK